MKAKSIIILAVLLLAFGVTYAQTSYSCSSRVVCLLNEDYEVQNCSDEDDAPSLFVLNESEGTITLTTFEVSLTFEIKSSNRADIGIVYNVEDEAGGEGIINFNRDEKKVGYIFTSSEGKVMVIYNVKAIF